MSAALSICVRGGFSASAGHAGGQAGGGLALKSAEAKKDLSDANLASGSIFSSNVKIRGRASSRWGEPDFSKILHAHGRKNSTISDSRRRGSPRPAAYNRTRWCKILHTRVRSYTRSGKHAVKS